MKAGIFTSLTFALLSLGGLHAQEAIVTSGGKSTGNGGSSSHSIGQVFYTSQYSTDGSVTQGIQQVYDITATVGTELPVPNFHLTVYPNPTRQKLILNADAFHNEKLTFHLISPEGKLLDSRSIITMQTVMDMKEFPAGMYHLQIQSEGTLIKNFRIIKH
ncbi:T9SS type A sorting domain-containing protein [Fulvivirga aurantia]|uniref:T9SS type A sorting domain-containing protein n=1 Tax=Fulvivirga aurantia TaxID=2529383 RepID=UPI001628BF4B|nr:T9SS type A sorting domain-containing protein [Fulvivirga aurantia]